MPLPLLSQLYAGLQAQLHVLDAGSRPPLPDVHFPQPPAPHVHVSSPHVIALAQEHLEVCAMQGAVCASKASTAKRPALTI